MAGGRGTVTFRFLGDASHLERTLDTTGNALGKVGGSMASLGKNIAIGLGAATAAAIPFGIKAVMMASDVNESLSKVNTVFGQSGEAIDKWAKGAAQSIGLSRGAALDAAGSFGNMFVQLGIGDKQAAKMSTSIVDLAADFASFHNADITDVISAQSAAFRGEYDALQRYLPLINAAAVEQEASAMTGKKNLDSLTQQEKALAVQSLMLKGAGDAQGDFARTSDGLANKMRILKARGEDFVAMVGSALLPVALRGIDIFMNLGNTFRSFVGPALETLRPMVENLRFAFEALLAADVFGFGEYIGQAFGLDSKAMGAIGTFTSKVFLFAEDVKKFVRGLIGTFQSGEGAIGDTTSRLSGIVDELKTTFASAFGAIQAVVVTAIDFVRGVYRVFGDDIASFTREFVAAILETFDGLIRAIRGVFDFIKAVLSGEWGDAWEALKTIFDGVWDAIFALLRNAVTNVIPTIIAGLSQAVSSVARTAFDGLKSAFQGAMNWIIEKWNDFKIPGVSVLGVQVSPEVNFPDLPTFHSGGMVPGPPGADVLGVLRAGEQVIPVGGRSVGMTVVANFYGPIDPAGAARQIQEILLQEKNRSGPLGLS